MIEAPIYSNFVSQRVDMGFADAADAVDQLVGRTIESGKVQLTIKSRLDSRSSDHVSYSAVLRSGGLHPAQTVDVVVSPWSAGRSELGIRPLARLGLPVSLRTRRFLDSAWKVMPTLQASLVRPAAEVAVPVLETIEAAA